MMTNRTAWNISIKTGDGERSGTNAQVFVCLVGADEHTSATVPLDNKTDQLVEGKAASFDARIMDDVKNPWKLAVWHDNSGVDPSWFLDHIMLTNPVNGKSYKFTCKRWLSSTEDDQKTWRILPLS